MTLDHPVNSGPALRYLYHCNLEFTSPCKLLYAGWSEVCRTWPGLQKLDDPIVFDKAWHEHNIATFITSIQIKHQVPIFANQWLAVHGLTRSQGRYDYMADLMQVLEAADIGWAWWTFIGGDAGGQWKNGSSEIVYRKPDGSTMLDNDALSTMAPFL